MSSSRQRRTSRRRFLHSTAAVLSALAAAPMLGCARQRRPNILFFITDDQSWLDCSVYGSRFLRTPHLDRLAREGVTFTHAFASSPSCTPSRASICTGRHFWELGRGAVLHSTLPNRYAVYQDLLAQAGYAVGYSGKGWAPGNVEAGGRTRNPAGPAYNHFQVPSSLPRGFSRIDYARNLAGFLADRPAGSPFSFWIGTFEPHAPYNPDNHEQLEMGLDELPLPSFVPDTPAIRRERGNFFFEIEYADRQLGRAIEALDSAGELDNTLIVFASDNGTALPRAKPDLYDWGTRVPLIAWWPDRIGAGRTVDDPVSLAGLAPTFLEAADVKPPEDMSVPGFLDLLEAGGSGHLTDSRTEVYGGLEWHRTAYPMRMIRTRTHLYIENSDSGPRWPRNRDLEDRSPPYEVGSQRFNAHQTLLRYPNHPAVRPYWEKCFGPRPARELFEIATDPENLHNLAEEPEHRNLVDRLSRRLTAERVETGDPRATGRPEVFTEAVAEVEGRSRKAD